jgi:hypothetical protein
VVLHCCDSPACQCGLSRQAWRLQRRLESEIQPHCTTSKHHISGFSLTFDWITLKTSQPHLLMTSCVKRSCLLLLSRHSRFYLRKQPSSFLATLRMHNSPPVDLAHRQQAHASLLRYHSSNSRRETSSATMVGMENNEAAADFLSFVHASPTRKAPRSPSLRSMPLY